MAGTRLQPSLHIHIHIHTHLQPGRLRTQPVALVAHSLELGAQAVALCGGALVLRLQLPSTALHLRLHVPSTALHLDELPL